MDAKLLLFDLDGTLLNSSREIPAGSLALLDELMAEGLYVGLATGRSLRSALPFARQIGTNGPLVVFNGGLVWDPVLETPIAERRLPREDALSALRLAAELDLHVNLYLGNEIAIAHRSPTSMASEIKDGVPHTIVGDLIGSCVDDPYKILLIDDERRFEAFEARFPALSKTPCTLVRSEPTYLEVLPAGVCKGAALDAVQGHLQISAGQIIAFGDGLNDIELLDDCGYGVAMGNALDAVKEHADVVIDHCDTDAIEHFLSGRFRPH